VTQRNIANLLNDIAAASGDVSANRVRAVLTAFFGWVIREGIRMPEGNIAGNTNVREERPRDRVLTDDELRKIWVAAGEDSRGRGGRESYGNVVKLLMLTGQRRDEIGALQWAEIVGDKIELPAARTKNARTHTVPLSDAAQEILAGAARLGPYVFGRRGQHRFVGFSAAKRRLDKHVDIVPWRLHDLRRTVATRMGDLGVQPHIIEAVLNHASGHKSGVAGVYNRATYDREKREALNLWAAHLTTVVEGRDPTIVPLRRA
jgi:integrase